MLQVSSAGRMYSSISCGSPSSISARTPGFLGVRVWGFTEIFCLCVSSSSANSCAVSNRDSCPSNWLDASVEDPNSFLRACRSAWIIFSIWIFCFSIFSFFSSMIRSFSSSCCFCFAASSRSISSSSCSVMYMISLFFTAYILPFFLYFCH